MRTIEVTTTQNVTIEYELADVRNRILAFAIDFTIIWLAMLFISIFSSAFHSNIVFWFVLLPVVLFYSLALEILNNGQSWGKKAMGICVVKINGTKCSAGDYLIRWAFRLVDIYFSLGSVASLLISSTERAQRLGDIAANTTVVRIRPKNILHLKDIMNISSHQNYVPKYPAVRQMKESEMLIVKNVLERVKKYPNEAHREAVVNLAAIMKERLNLVEATANPVSFLNTVLNDYIVLTR